MNYDEACAVDKNPRIKSYRKLYQAATRINETANPADQPMVERLFERAKTAFLVKPL